MLNTQKIRVLMARASQIFTNFLKKEEDIKHQAGQILEEKMKEKDQQKIDQIKHKINEL
ncbi:MAG: hypothetical protein ABIH87_02085 [bacterium]